MKYEFFALFLCSGKGTENWGDEKRASPVVGDVRYGMGSGAFIFGLVDDHAAGGWVICVFQL